MKRRSVRRGAGGGAGAVLSVARAWDHADGVRAVPRLGLDIQLEHDMLARDPTAGLSPWYALVEVNRMRGGVPGALEAALEAAMEEGWSADAGDCPVGGGPQLMWAFREQMSECQSREGASIKHDSLCRSRRCRN